jgi:hypothetical protein
MPTEAPAIPTEQSIAKFIDSAYDFTRGMDVWFRRFGADRGHTGAQRLMLLHERAQLGCLRRAIRLRRSIGFYGESQCGKSNLVSRIGEGLGARATPSGSLLVLDPTPAGERGPWSADGHEGCIEFAKWLNPIAGTESTGVICRLTTRVNPDSPPGCFVARLMSHADLLMSVALGNSEDTSYDGRPQELAEAVKQLRAGPLEDDPERFSEQLLVAWRFLQSRWKDGANARRVHELEQCLWVDFVEDLFKKGKRPAWNPEPGEFSPYLKLAAMLWSSQPHLSDMYRRLLQALSSLQGSEEIFVSALDACRSGGDGAFHHSLLDVRNIDSLFEESVGSRGVRVTFRAQHGAFVSSSIPRSMLCALVRELELPLAVHGDAPASPIDVLDYPGARPTSADGRIEGNMQPQDRALAVFRRGKLNRLFLSGVDLQDCSALCLVVTGNGPLNAGPVMRQSLHPWFIREAGGEWRSAATPMDRLPQEPHPVRIDPPLVVAVSKSDMMVNENADAGSLFGGRLRELDKEYCKGENGLDWISRWPSGIFNRVHWVHNPDVPGSVKLRDFASTRASALARIRTSYLADQMVQRHVADPGRRFDDLFQASADVNALFDSLRTVIQRSHREARIVEGALELLDHVVGVASSDYLGPDPRARVAEERRKAQADVAAFQAVLSQGRNPVASILRALQVSPLDVQRACRAAHAETASAEAGEVGVLKFDDFYRLMCDGFAERIDGRLRQENLLGRMLNSATDSAVHHDVLASIRDHFARMPGMPWFRSRVETPVASMFQAMNPEALAASPVLAAVVSTAWNRSVVWLDREPALPAELPKIPPVRRPVHASSAKIVGHWSSRLPDVYEAMVDPAGAARPGNAELGKMLRDLRSAVSAMSTSLRAAGITDPAGRLRALEDSLPN